MSFKESLKKFNEKGENNIHKSSINSTPSPFSKKKIQNEYDISSTNTTPSTLENQTINKKINKITCPFSSKNTYLAKTSNFSKNYDDIIKSLTQLDEFSLVKANSHNDNPMKVVYEKNEEKTSATNSSIKNELGFGEDMFRKKSQTLKNKTTCDLWKNNDDKNFLTSKDFKGGPLKNYFSNCKNKEDKILKENRIKDLSHIEDIKDYYDYTEECLLMIPKILKPSEEEINQIQNQVCFSNSLKGKKLAIFDLDETLIHCDYKNIYNCDVILTILSPSNEQFKIGINIRPHLIESLNEIKKTHELIIYTASHKSYADTILDYIDPDNSIFSYRLYRNHCIKTTLKNEIIYIKDLRIFKDLNEKDMIIIDNSVLSFAFHLNNGIPILPYYNNKNDNEFPTLVNYLKHLSTFDDSRLENKKYIKLEFFLKQRLDPVICLDVESEDDDSSQIEDSDFFEEISLINFMDKNENFRKNLELCVKNYKKTFK